MSLVVAAFVGLCLYGMIRILNLASPSLPPNIYAKTRNSDFIQAIISSCPILREPYTPPLLWGKSGHIQTMVYSKVGRVQETLPNGVRHTKTLADGSTLTFDVYEPTGRHKCKGQYCMLVCPGFGSSSESAYIRTLTDHAQSLGYHVAVLNHLGSLFSVRLTAPRIFSYGGWEEFHIMRQEVERLYPQCKLIVVGLSMGANIVLKYLGEQMSHQTGVWCAISVCQGYNINEAKHHMLKWESLRRAYLHFMTANQRRLIRHHSQILFTEKNQRRYNFDLKKIFSATTLEELDAHFTCKLQGYQDVVTYYEKNSCSNYLSNIRVPLIMLNAEDDPIVPPALLKYAREHAETHDHAVFITTKHGGHLGYFESGYLRPQAVSWLDRCICQVANAVVSFQEQRELESFISGLSADVDHKGEFQALGTRRKQEAAEMNLLERMENMEDEDHPASLGAMEHSSMRALMAGDHAAFPLVSSSSSDALILSSPQWSSLPWSDNSSSDAAFPAGVHTSFSESENWSSGGMGKSEQHRELQDAKNSLSGISIRELASQALAGVTMESADSGALAGVTMESADSGALAGVTMESADSGALAGVTMESADSGVLVSADSGVLAGVTVESVDSGVLAGVATESADSGSLVSADSGVSSKPTEVEEIGRCVVSHTAEGKQLDEFLLESAVEEEDSSSAMAGQADVVSMRD